MEKSIFVLCLCHYLRKVLKISPEDFFSVHPNVAMGSDNKGQTNLVLHIDGNIFNETLFVLTKQQYGTTSLLRNER